LRLQSRCGWPRAGTQRRCLAAPATAGKCRAGTPAWVNGWCVRGGSRRSVRRCGAPTTSHTWGGFRWNVRV